MDEELEKLRFKFYNKTKQLYPNVRYPQVCWLFDVALGIDPRIVAAEPISHKQYTVLILDENGKRIIRNKEILKVVRKFDSKQAKIVREWWPLIPDDIKV